MNVGAAIRERRRSAGRALLSVRVMALDAEGYNRLQIRQTLGVSAQVVTDILGRVPYRQPRYDRIEVPEGLPEYYRNNYVRNLRRYGEDRAREIARAYAAKHRISLKERPVMTVPTTPKPEPQRVTEGGEWAPTPLKAGMRSGGRAVEPGMVLYSAADMIRVAARSVGLPTEALKGERKTALVNQGRQIAMWLMRRYTRMSLIRISEALGRSDHTTSRHGITQVERQIYKAGLHPCDDPVKISDALSRLDWSNVRGRP